MIRSTLLVTALAVALTAPDALAQGGRGGGRGGAAAGPTPPPTNPGALPVSPRPAYVRGDAPTDAGILKIWEEGMQRSQVMTLAQQLLDSVGPRLTGSTDADRAAQYVMGKYREWGIPSRLENYGTWTGWQNGAAFAALSFPRRRNLEVNPMGWTPGTEGRWLEGEVVMIPENVTTPEAFTAWLPNVRGKFVLLSAPQLSCRPASQWAEFGTAESRDRLRNEQSALSASMNQRQLAGGGPRGIQARLKEGGALGALTFQFSAYPGINKVFGSPSQQVPTIDVSCEDYGLLFRLAQNKQGPTMQLYIDARKYEERPIGNVIAEIKGTTKPNEYIVLSAHFDSFTGGSGATDNGTGTLTMFEAMRILKAAYPNPKRTILIGHWNSEEQGLNGSKAFAEDHPEVLKGLHALFNQDNGTGRIVSISPGPFTKVGAALERYMSAMPSEVTQWIRLGGTAPFGGVGSTDHTTFICYKTPGIGTSALPWDYSNTTWHTNRDTYDKVVPEDIRNNAVLIAMLAYMASEDPTFMPRDLVPQENWPNCPPATRSAANSSR
jgi:carboxypeptidase Q